MTINNNNLNTLDSLHLLVVSSFYQDILLDVQCELSLIINKDVHQQLFTHDIVKLNIANLSVVDLNDILLNYPFLIKSFVKDKLTNKTVNDGTSHYFYANFIIIYLIELFFLINNKLDDLALYLKAIRIPKNKAYMQELTVIYNSLKS